jgi:hypothetical protein
MVDGLGIPPAGWTKSFFSEFHKEFSTLLSKNSIPVSTDMEIQGLPQSATGQTSLFTGINSAKQLGMHVQGFPGLKLREIINKNNIFKFLIENGLRVSFANAYIRYTLEELKNMNFRSVTTVMTESAIGWVRNIESILANKAVYHDITSETAHTASPFIKKISPEKAAENLLSVAGEHDFTLFEYFLTDRAGHKMDMNALKDSISNLGRFVVEITKSLGNTTSLILTSDHGNSENMNVTTHTLNPVPFMGINMNINNLEKINIQDIFSIVVKNMELK